MKRYDHQKQHRSENHDAKSRHQEGVMRMFRVVAAICLGLFLASYAAGRAKSQDLPDRRAFFSGNKGPPPRAPWKRQTVHPRTAGALHRSRVRFEVAEQRGAFWNEYVRFMGSPPPCFGTPRPPWFTLPTIACPPSFTVTCS